MTGAAADREMDRMAERRAALVALGLNPGITHSIADRVAAWKHQWLVVPDETRAILRELAPSLGINVESME